MHRPFALVRELARTNPLLLLDIKDRRTIQYAESLLPYSIGLEFECSQLASTDFDTYIKNVNHYLTGLGRVKDVIPNLMAIGTDSGEQRFRIPKGIKGLVCLWHITLFLKKYYGLNPSSGVHYHIDMSDMKSFWYHMMFSGSFRYNFIAKNNSWIIRTLRDWKYKGTFNSMKITYDLKEAVKFHSTLKTMEVRIGEMTFDYGLLYKRITHSCNIAKKIRKELVLPEIETVKKHGINEGGSPNYVSTSSSRTTSPDIYALTGLYDF